jgi:pyridoxine 4-dehydrogenase
MRLSVIRPTLVRLSLLPGPQGTVDGHDARAVESVVVTVCIGGDLEVHRIGLGTIGTVGPGFLGPPADPGQAATVLRRAIDLGVDLIDTADAYGPYISEELIAETLSPYPPGLVIATKGGSLRPGGPYDWGHDGRPEHLRRACESSLRRLRVEALPLYQYHWPDTEVPFSESIGALRDLRDEGKVRHIGISNVSLGQLREACSIVEVASVQNSYSLADRASEALIGECERRGIVFLAYEPLTVGSTGLEHALREVCAEVGATAAQVRLAWLLCRSPVLVPIPGTSSPSHLAENAAAADLQLTARQWARLDRAAPPTVTRPADERT